MTTTTNFADVLRKRLEADQELAAAVERERIPLVPPNWDHPDWCNTRKCHDWRNHVPLGVEDLWETFSREQKQMLALWAETLANEEEWE